MTTTNPIDEIVDGTPKGSSRPLPDGRPTAVMTISYRGIMAMFVAIVLTIGATLGFVAFQHYQAQQRAKSLATHACALMMKAISGHDGDSAGPDIEAAIRTAKRSEKADPQRYAGFGPAMINVNQARAAIAHSVVQGMIASLGGNEGTATGPSMQNLIRAQTASVQTINTYCH